MPLDTGKTALGEWPEQRVGLFVDTQNLYYGARDNFGRQVDYQRLLQLALRGRRLAQATSYVVEREGDSSAYGFFTKLSMLGYRVRRRKLRVHRLEEEGRTVMEGDWDMGIVADIVRSCAHLDVVALASGDADFVPILDIAQEWGLRVEVLAFKESVGQDLVDLADAFVNLSEAEKIFVE